MTAILIAVMLCQNLPNDPMDRMRRQQMELESLHRSDADVQMDRIRKEAMDAEFKREAALTAVDSMIAELVSLRRSLDATNQVTDLRQRRKLARAWKQVQKIGIPEE